MDNESSINRKIFLLGAGFNCDATSEACRKKPFPPGIKPRYPLVNDLLKNCFEIDTLPSGKSIENLFQDSINSGNGKPLDKLYDLIMEADYYLTPLLKFDGTKADNIYMKFLYDFPDSPLLTFNYDSNYRNIQ